MKAFSIIVFLYLLPRAYIKILSSLFFVICLFMKFFCLIVYSWPGAVWRVLTVLCLLSVVHFADTGIDCLHF